MAQSSTKPRRKPRRNETKLAFDALFIEGGLLAPEWLAKVASLEAGGQAESDYRVLKGLHLRDEIGRYWRVAQALWADFAAGRASGADPKALTERFVVPMLRDAFGWSSLTAVDPAVIAERTYPIGYAALGGRAPVVLAPAGSGLDTLAPAYGDGLRRRSAFGLAQEYLNAAESAMWGVASDGVTLRIVRDNASLTRPAWIEANLGRIFTEERYADFAALWLLAHETRFGKLDQPAAECALEAWRAAGREEGTRAREDLRNGVEEAVLALGNGFVSHPENGALRAALQDGSLKDREFFNQLLRLVYRLIFLLTVEERGLLHPDGTKDAVRALYAEGYSLRRLRERSAKRSAHDRHADLWEAVKVVFRGVAGGEPRLGLPALAGIFAKSQCPALDAAKLENRALLLGVFRLSWLRTAAGLSRVNWRDMGPEELGSVYESLLELVPVVSVASRSFAFAKGDEAKGNARKTSGSYYTPESLVQVLLDSALEPVIKETVAANPTKPVEALLNLSIVDPACGSGHFLLAAAERLAAHVARLQTNGTPSIAEYRHALRQVVGRCVYGVDLNSMAVELCKVALWMQAVEPGLPLTFLDAHIQHGNALLGTTPELMAKGIPNTAWEAIEGDDKKVASALKKRNAKEAAGQTTMASLWGKPAGSESEEVARAVAALEEASDADAGALAAKESKWGEILASEAFQHQKFVADAWCTAFVWPKPSVGGPVVDGAPTMGLWGDIRDGKGKPSALTVKTAEELAAEYHFFHWHLAFPTVFHRGGFDVALGNPPWVSYTGRQAVPPGRILGLLLARFPAIARWPATHPAFLLLSCCLLRKGGRVGIVLPRQVGDLDAYGPVRAEVTAAARLYRPIVDAGEDSFVGVTQPVGLFTLEVVDSAQCSSPAVWPVEQDGNKPIVQTGGLPKLTALLAHQPRFPLKTFLDPGVHTGNVSKKIILDKPLSEATCALVREGRDINPYVCMAPRKWLWFAPALEDNEYCTIRPAVRYQEIPILLRQTADRPIAARHTDRTYFRNSLLACVGVEGVPDTVVIGFLNSALYAALHREAARDADQKAFPQVKIRHLHTLPGIPISGLGRTWEGATLISVLAATCLEAEAAARRGDFDVALRLRIERLVLTAFDLPESWAELLLEEVG